MVSWDAAVMIMMMLSAAGFLLSDGEKRRVYWVRAMRRCLLRMSSIIRYEQPGLPELLVRIDLGAAPQERALTQMLHRCAGQMKDDAHAPLAVLFARESAKVSGYGVLSEEDRAAFEHVLSELGQNRLGEQLRMIDCADEQLRAREEALARESGMRARLIRTLGVCCGVGAFLILI